MRRPVLAFAVLALATSLGGCSSHRGSCSEDDRKAQVLAVAQGWYLYGDLLPAVSPAAYASADALLDALTAPARAQGVEREGWTHLMSAAAYDQYFHAAQSVGYGFSLVLQGARPDQRVFVKQVFAGSAAAAAGFVRGDEILSIGPDAASLVDVADAGDVGALSSAGGAAGVSRAWRVIPRGASTPLARTMVSAAYDVDPVPASRIWGTTGYVQLRTFIEPAEPALRSAFAAFQAAGVQDVIVDLRYNGGGAVHTAVVLADLLAADLAGREMFSVRFNAQHQDKDQHVTFAGEESGGTFRRVAFVTTSGSASASELVPNVLDPYRSPTTIAYAGARTYGKPVGQSVFTLDGCGSVLFLITFRLQNSAGDAGYFDGLPDANSHAPLCPADDDLAHDQDDPAEAMTATARAFVEDGQCPTHASASRALRAAAPVDHLVGRGATPAEWDMPGTF